MRVPSRHRARRSLLALAIACAGLLCSAPAAFAVGLTVDSLADSEGTTCSSTTSCTLREAINLVAEGEEGEEEIAGDVTIDFSVEGKIEVEDEFELELGEGVESLTILGPGWEKLAIDGTGKTRVFRVPQGEVTIAGLMVENGFLSGGIADEDGGAALLQKGGELTLDEVRFTRNHIEDDRAGGAIDVEEGDLTIIDSTIDHNTANAESIEEGGGGGINLDDSASTLTVRGTEVAGNESMSGYGGGILQEEGNLVVESSVITGNKALGEYGLGYGGGVASKQDGAHTTKIERTTISGNSAPVGGGLYTEAGAGGVVVTESTVSDNTADAGAGVGVAGPTTIEASTVSGNEASELAGGIAVDSHFSTPFASASLLLDTSTVADNAGGGVHNQDGEVQVRASTISANTNSAAAAAGITGAAGEQMPVRSSIVSGNTGNAGPGDCAIAVISGGHNIVGAQEPGCTWSEAEGDQFAISPQLGPLADNGGPTETMAPVSAASPAINHGGDPTRNDQRGLTRPVPVGVANTDVGAVEVQAPINESAPEIAYDGALVEGTELTCEPGGWDNDTVTDASYSYSWRVDDAAVASGSTLELNADDAGKDVVCQVTANNGVTTTAANSAPVELQPGALSLSPTSYDFGSRNANSGPSAPKTFTVKNEGGTVVSEIAYFTTDEINFPVEPSACTNASLAPGEECTINVRFQPRNPATSTANLNVTSDVPTVSASLEGTGTEGAISILPGAFDFGSRRVDSGPSTAQTFEVSSAGTGPVTLGTLAIAGTGAAEFALVADGDECSGETLQAGEICEVEVVFDPSATGASSAVLTVPSDLPTLTAELKGTGTLPAVTVTPSSFDFGPQPLGAGASAAQLFTVESTGNEALTLGTPTVSAEFAIPLGSDECAGETLQPGEECTIEVVFDPATLGAKSGVLSVPSDVPTATASLSGTGAADPSFSANPSDLGFGSNQVGTTTTRTVTISNLGGVPASVDTVAIVGTDPAFSLSAGGDECSGTDLAPAATCTVEVSFSPSSAGAASATLEIDGAAPTLAVPLSGSGVAKPLPAPPTASLLGAGTVRTGAAGAAPLTVGCSSPGGSACQVTVVLQAGGSTLGSWSGSIAAGASSAAEVPLSAAARKQLGAKGRLAAEAVLGVAGGNGATVPLTLLAPPAPKLKLKSVKRAGNTLVFKLSCQGFAAKCQGKLTLTAKGGAKLAAGKVSLAKGNGEKALALTPAGRRLLDAEPRLNLVAKLSVRDPVYQRTTLTERRLRLGS